MHEFTDQFLKRLWRSPGGLEVIAARLSGECAKMSPAEAGIVGKDLLLRYRRLCTKKFELAAYLASDGLAGNDGLIDFRDCVTILPDDRFLRIAESPDELIEDEVSTAFGEFRFVSSVTNVFDHALCDGEEGLLHYLVLGEETSAGMDSDSSDVVEADIHLPRLYEKFGHLLRPSRVPLAELSSDRVTLDDFIR